MMFEPGILLDGGVSKGLFRIDLYGGDAVEPRICLYRGNVKIRDFDHSDLDTPGSYASLKSLSKSAGHLFAGGAKALGRLFGILASQNGPYHVFNRLLAIVYLEECFARIDDSVADHHIKVAFDAIAGNDSLILIMNRILFRLD